MWFEEPGAELAAALANMHGPHQAHVCPTSHAADYPPNQVCSPEERKRTQQQGDKQRGRHNT